MKRPATLALLLLASSSLSCVLWPEGSGPDASHMPLAEALERRDRGEAEIVDVRSAERYREGHIPGALHVPAAEVESRAGEIRRWGKLPILYCG